MRRAWGAKRLLSARNLDDVPASVRIGSPLDVPDHLVYQLAAGGLLHPGTNYGVVYRVAFAPVLEPGEEPAPPMTLQGLPVEGFPTNLLLRTVFVFPPDVLSVGKESIDLRITRTDLEHARYQGWVLLTNRGVRWHYTGDGAPQVRPGIEPELGGGVRFLPHEDLRGTSAHRQITLPPVSGQAVDLDLFVFDVRGSGYGFGVAGSYQPENLRWFDFIRGRESLGHPVARPLDRALQKGEVNVALDLVAEATCQRDRLETDHLPIVCPKIVQPTLEGDDFLRLAFGGPPLDYRHVLDPIRPRHAGHSRKPSLFSLTSSGLLPPSGAGRCE